MGADLLLELVLAEGSGGHPGCRNARCAIGGLGGHKCALSTPLGEARLEEGSRHGSNGVGKRDRDQRSASQMLMGRLM